MELGDLILNSIMIYPSVLYSGYYSCSSSQSKHHAITLIQEIDLLQDYS